MKRPGQLQCLKERGEILGVSKILARKVRISKYEVYLLEIVKE